jgi:uncharacterized protein
MPAALTYPGVYVEEIPSGVRTITGVATSIAAFVGRTAMGPVDMPVTTTSWDDFVRNFGGLSLGYPVGFAVRDFYLNGGAQAVIVRASAGAAAPAQLDANGLKLEASSAGTWGNTLRARVTKTDAAKLGEIAQLLGVAATDLFNLAIYDTRTGTTETFLNLTAKQASARHVTGILLNESTLARTKGAATVDPTAHADPAAGKDIWEDDNASSKVGTAGADSDKLTKVEDFGEEGGGTGLFALRHADLFNLLCIPPDTLGEEVPKDLHALAADYCFRRRALYIADPPKAWTGPDKVDLDNINITGLNARNAAVYFPRVIQGNPLRGDQPEAFVPCGAVAGVMARTDETRGVWKAPAGVDASLTGVLGLSVPLTDKQNGLLNPIGVNCLRTFPIIGNIVWGARTLRGADILGDEYKYVPVRRTALFIEESLFRGLKWVVFEPNDEPLWGQIRLNVGAFMQNLFRQGAFQGTSARDAYFVKCDKDTTTQNDINLGIVNVVVGFAPLKPAEFVVLKIQQMAGQIQT